MAKDRTEEILDSLLNDIGIEVDEFIAQVHKREPVKAPSDGLSPQKNDTPSLIPKPPKADDIPTSPSGTKAAQPEFDPEDLKNTFAPKPKAPSGPEQASSPSGMSGGGSPDVQQSMSGYGPNSKLPWFKHGMKGFFRKLWHGDHPENPSWQGYKAEQRLTLDECIFLNKQISEKVDQLSNQFLTEAVTDYDDLVNSLKEKIASHFRQAVAEARQKGSNSRGAGRKTNLETLNTFLSQLGIDPLTNLDEAMETLINKINTDEIDMEGWEFVKNKNTWTLRKGTRTLPPFGNQGKGIIQRLINKKKSPVAASAEMSSSSAPTADDVEAGKGDDKPTTSGVVSKVKPISPPTSTDGGQTDAKAKKSLVRAIDIKNILKREYIAAANIADLGEERKEFEYYAKILKSPLNVLEKNEKFKTDWQSEGENIEEALAKMFISDLGLNKTPKEILSMTKEELEKIVSDWHAQIPDKEEKKEPRKAYKPDPSKMGALDSDDFDDFEEGSSLDAYKATKILEQLTPHHKLMYYKKLLSCGVRMSSNKINLNEVRNHEKVIYLKDKLRSL